MLIFYWEFYLTKNLNYLSMFIMEKHNSSVWTCVLLIYFYICYQKRFHCLFKQGNFNNKNNNNKHDKCRKHLQNVKEHVRTIKIMWHNKSTMWHNKTIMWHNKTIIKIMWHNKTIIKIMRHNKTILQIMWQQKQS